MSALLPRSDVLITGVTGLLGGEILRELAKRDVCEISALVRSKDCLSPRDRFSQRMERSSDPTDTYSERAIVIEGDVARPKWGLSPHAARYVAERVDTIVHCAADTSFINDKSVIETNIQGTRYLIDLAKSARNPPRIVYISTASNVGRVQHCCLKEEQGCQATNEHHNSYTKSKAVAETLLRESGLDVLVIRPTIVLSGGLSDRLFARNILWFAPLLCEFDALPVNPTAEMDVISSDFMARGVVELMLSGDLKHDCYHISAGHRHGMTTCEAVESMNRFYCRKQPQLIAPEEWTPAEQRRFVQTREQRKIFHALRYYLPFLNMDVTFDNTRLYQDLGDRVPEFDTFDSYSDHLLNQIGLNDAIAEMALP